MNNPLKFRVWSKLLKRFAVDTEFSHILYQDEDFSKGTFTVNGDNCVIQQYTGVKDREGREIYEGDIVRDVFEHTLKKVVRGKGIFFFSNIKEPQFGFEACWLENGDKLSCYWIVGHINDGLTKW